MCGRTIDDDGGVVQDRRVDRELWVALGLAGFVAILLIALAVFVVVRRDSFDATACEQARAAQLDARDAAIAEFGENAIISDGVPPECLEGR